MDIGSQGNEYHMFDSATFVTVFYGQVGHRENMFNIKILR